MFSAHGDATLTSLAIITGNCCVNHKYHYSMEVEVESHDIYVHS